MSGVICCERCDRDSERFLRGPGRIIPMCELHVEWKRLQFRKWDLLFEIIFTDGRTRQGRALKARAKKLKEERAALLRELTGRELRAKIRLKRREVEL